MRERTYLCIDLKSFYASVECVSRGLDPLTALLVVADPERTEKTICLAISPAMKKLGIKNRCRVFEIPDDIDYIMATPRMQTYIDVSAEIYGVYLSYFSKDDIHVYSIDEAFIDVTDYLTLYGCDALNMARKIIKDVFTKTGITATAGIGSNLYLAKIAMDIEAKHAKDNIGILNEQTFKEKMWNHLPLTDFWRIGPGTVRRLNMLGLYTMRDIAMCDEDILYKQFGIDAELLIDHANGIETTLMRDIKNYKPSSTSYSTNQVLACDYEYDDALLIVKEMTDELCFELINNKVTARHLSLMVGYSNALELNMDGGSRTLLTPSNSAKVMRDNMEIIFRENIDKSLPIRRVGVSFSGLEDETFRQYDLFSNLDSELKEHEMQNAMISIKNRFGRNAILKGMNLYEKGTMQERNRQIGGHKSGK